MVNFLIQINHWSLQPLKKYENTFLQFSSHHWISPASQSITYGSGKWSNQTRYAHSKNAVSSSPYSLSQYSWVREFNMCASAFVTCICGWYSILVEQEILLWKYRNGLEFSFRVWNSGLWWLLVWVLASLASHRMPLYKLMISAHTMQVANQSANRILLKISA